MIAMIIKDLLIAALIIFLMLIFGMWVFLRATDEKKLQPKPRVQSVKPEIVNRIHPSVKVQGPIKSWQDLLSLKVKRGDQ